MRDKQFIAVHRGGLLTKANHQKLIRWARECAEHGWPLLNEPIDPRLVRALAVAKEWENENVKVGEARKAAVNAQAVARESLNPVVTAIARAIGHTVATAHMADHALGGALYALQAVKLAGKSINDEREWQIKQLPQLPAELVELVLTTKLQKEKSLGIL